VDEELEKEGERAPVKEKNSTTGTTIYNGDCFFLAICPNYLAYDLFCL
jgi:hypothetical protein